MKEQLPAATLDGLSVVVSEFGVDFQALADEVGLSPYINSDGDRRFPHRKLLELANLAARRSRRRDLGLVWGARSNPMLLGPLGVAMLNAPTARRALQLFVERLPSQNEVLRAALVPREKRGLELLSLVNNMTRPPSLVHVKERNIGILLGILRTLLGVQYSPAEIWLSHPRHADLDAYRRAYGMLPIFDQDVCGVVLTTSDLDKRVAGHRRDVFEMAVSYLGQTPASEAPADDAIATAAAVLATNRSYRLGEVASIMGVHARGLQRRLQEAGVTYSMLRDSALRREAERLLRDGDRLLTDVAFELSFKDQAAFTRASRRWFGLPPGAARIRLRELFEQDAAKTDRTDTLTVARRLRSRPEGV